MVSNKYVNYWVFNIEAGNTTKQLEFFISQTTASFLAKKYSRLLGRSQSSGYVSGAGPGGGEADLHTKRFQLPKSPNPHRQIEPNGSLVHS